LLFKEASWTLAQQLDVAQVASEMLHQCLVEIVMDEAATATPSASALTDVSKFLLWTRRNECKVLVVIGIFSHVYYLVQSERSITVKFRCIWHAVCDETSS